MVQDTTDVPPATAEARDSGVAGGREQKDEPGPGDNIFWAPLGEECPNHPGSVAVPSRQEGSEKDPTREAESIALAQLLQIEEDGIRQEGLNDRARAQVMQDEDDANTTADEWI
eukprot:6864420-Heterocapsa_arctica.AAC.1